jgi:hypothetical protein
LNPQGSFALHPHWREDLGGCGSADHPKLPVQPRGKCVQNYLFGSGSAGLGD